MSGRKVAALLVFVFLLAQGFAQTTPAQTKQTPTVVSNVDEVTLDLVVRDKKNKPILDLKPEDITVSDNGAAVKLSDLRLMTGQSGSNHLITLLFDRLDPSAATNAREVARKILKLIPANGFSLSVLTIAGRLHMLQQFTPDRDAIAKAVNAATSVDDSERDTADIPFPEKELIAQAQTGSDLLGKRVSSNGRTVAQMMLASLQESQRLVQEQHARPSLAGLLALARTQRQIPGRKVVIYFTEGMTYGGNEQDMAHSVSAAASRAAVGIYVVDVSSVTSQTDENLVAMAAMGNVRSAMAQTPAAPAFTTGAGGPQTVPAPPPGLAPMVDNQYQRYEGADPNANKSPLGALAAATGGAYLYSRDNLKKPFGQMVEDFTTYYEASYVPAALQYDGQFHPVEVKAVRKGLKIRSRPGYFAVPPTSGIRPFEVPLMKLLAESQLPADLKFQAAVLRLGELPAGNENALVVELPIGELETRDDINSNLYTLHASIVAQIKDKAGEVLEHFSEDIPRHGALDSKASAQSDVTMQRHFVAGPGDYVLEAAVLDQNNGRAGAQRLEFSIPNEASGPSLSDVALVQRMDPLPPELYAEEPLRYGSEKVVPSLSGRMPKGNKNISFFFVVHPDPKSAEQPTLEMEVLKNNESIAQVPLKLRKIEGGGPVPYLASIQSRSLSSGDYQVIEKITQGGTSSEQAVSFRIEGPELAEANAPHSETEDAVDSMAAPGLAPPNSRRVVISSLPAGTVPQPSAEELESLIESARKRALEYRQSLPNFICVELTDRSVDSSGNGNWKHRDSLAELLRYEDNQESRSTLEVNGKRSSLKRTDLNSTWPMSVGEFGALLNLVFADSSKTTFEWKEAGTLGDGSGPLQVLSYRVARENATIDLSEGNNSIGAGFHGFVYIDGATGGVRRITLEADDLPRKFSMHAAAMTVDYDFVAIAGRDYLMPVHSSVSIQRHRHQTELNEITFRNYRRFASRTKIKMLH